MSVISRIAEIAAREGIKITTLERNIGASKGVLSRALNNDTDIHSRWLTIIVENYQSYNPFWILTGKGEMLSIGGENKSNTEIEGLPTSDFEKNFLEKQLDKKDMEISKLTQKIMQLNKEIGALEERIKILHSANNKEVPPESIS